MAKNYGKDGKWVLDRDLSGGAQSKTFLVHRKDDPDEHPYVLKRFSNLKRWHRYETEVAAALKLEHPISLQITKFIIARGYLRTKN